MEIKATDTFFKSLKKLVRHQTWWWKLYSLFRYKLIAFFKNIWLFRYVLWNHRDWDFRYSIQALKTSLEILDKGLSRSYEIEKSLSKKRIKLKRAIEILQHFDEDLFLDLAEKQLGYEYEANFDFEKVSDDPNLYQLKNMDDETKKKNKEIRILSDSIETKEWNELWEIIKGQDINIFFEKVKDMPAEDNLKNDYWDEWFDGSGMKNWWK